MYGLWILTIIFGVLFAGGLTAILIINYKYDDFYYSNWAIFVTVVIVLCGITFLLLLAFSIGGPICAEREVKRFLIEKEWIEAAIASGTDYENIMATHTVVEYNHWLAEAQASYLTKGNWSMYYNTNIMEIEPIMLP